MQAVMEFSASAFLEVYQGHIETFYHIRDNCPDSFRSMLADIYSQARYACVDVLWSLLITGSSNVAFETPTAVAMANLNLEELEG